MNTVPFVENHPDNMHCVNAVFRMVHQYFFRQDLSWKEIDTLTKAIPGKATWTFIGEMEFANKGLQITNIEPLDYARLYKEGVSYLHKILGGETAHYYIEKSNVVSVVPFIPRYLDVVRHETRRASVSEIIDCLKRGGLVGAEINSRILNNRLGFSLHFVLIYDYEADHLILHDPGAPPIQGRRVSFEEFNACFNFEGANGTVTLFEK